MKIAPVCGCAVYIKHGIVKGLCRQHYQAVNFQDNKASTLARRKSLEPPTDELRKRRRKYNEKYKRKHKAEVLSHYGNVCACCGEYRESFLTIDHINGGGRKHRLKIKKTGTSFYAWLKERGYPPGYQTLCMNCNWSKHRDGICTHQTEKQAKFA